MEKKSMQSHLAFGYKKKPFVVYIYSIYIF